VILARDVLDEASGEEHRCDGRQTRGPNPGLGFMKTTGHASTDMALRYVREAELFDDLAVEGLL